MFWSLRRLATGNDFRDSSTTKQKPAIGYETNAYANYVPGPDTSSLPDMDVTGVREILLGFPTLRGWVDNYAWIESTVVSEVKPKRKRLPYQRDNWNRNLNLELTG